MTAACASYRGTRPSEFVFHVHLKGIATALVVESDAAYAFPESPSPSEALSQAVKLNGI